MNGQCFPWHSVRKNRELGIFESIEPAPNADERR
jgi:hypothetical protein